MLFFFTWGVHFLYTALVNDQENRKFLWPIVFSAICFSCVCLTGWIGLWPMAGFLLFVGIRFKPHGLYCLPVLVILLLFPVSYTHLDVYKRQISVCWSAWIWMMRPTRSVLRVRGLYTVSPFLRTPAYTRMNTSLPTNLSAQSLNASTCLLYTSRCV